MSNEPKRGTAAAALQRLADLSRLEEPDTRAWGVVDEAPEAASFVYVVDGKKWIVRAEPAP